MSTSNVDLSAKLDSMQGLHWIGVGLALISGAIHLILGIQFLPHWMGFSFLVAAIGFVVGSWLVIADVKRRFVYLLGIPFTLGQIIAWVALTRPELIQDFDFTVLGPIEVIDKVAQVLLIVVLLVLYTQET
ncbi:hypothetical protein K0C01_12265 [Salinarchaeum sp. IM2453]|uniref:DUF7475 family protein n=1 Tax=Salinarchaeum sp. IM2453 TaxID=2862870 RepID=UPI001C8324FC|nr:hypothetical protein [Salinarchaeum sp. IM2453]QZA88536.1 hypothetical protein K0C01_12265 [Salinarchaeum sp. IM2453]